MAPLEIEVLLHYYYSTQDYPNQSDAVQQITKNFLEHGILIENPNYAKKEHRLRELRYIPNEEPMRIYIDKICSIPLPKKIWGMVDEN